MKSARAWALVAALLVLPIGIAVADQVEEAYSRLTGTFTNHRTAFSADDSAVATTAIDPQPTNGAPTIAVAPRFTVASATATVEVWLYDQENETRTLMGIAGVQTATASSLRRAGASGNYLTNTPLLFDTLGADVYDVRYRSVSSGNLEPFAWTVGATSAAAE
jgi:hypothetical protein